MSMSCSIRAVLTTDEEYKKMYAIYKACNDAGVSYPQEVVDYFGSAIDNGEVRKAGTIRYIDVEPVFDEEHYEQVYTVSLEDLPASTRAVQVALSW